MAVTTRIVGLDEVKELLEQLPEDLFLNAKQAFRKTLFEVQSDITTPMSGGANGLQSRTGNLARSVQVSLSGTKLDTLRSSVFTDSPYAPIHEKGGTIHAKNAYKGLAGGPFLNIPSDANKTPAGVQRMSATQVFNAGGYIVKISSAKARYMVILDGRPMFWLVNQVTIKARFKMIKTAEDGVPTLLSRLNDVLLEGVS